MSPAGYWQTNSWGTNWIPGTPDYTPEEAARINRKANERKYRSNWFDKSSYRSPSDAQLRTSAPPTNEMAKPAAPADVVGGVAVGTVKEFTGSSGNTERAVWTGKGWDATTKPVTAPAPTNEMATPTRSLQVVGAFDPNAFDQAEYDRMMGVVSKADSMVRTGAPAQMAVDHETRRAQSYNAELRREHAELVGYINNQPQGSAATEGYSRRLGEINKILTATVTPGSTALNPGRDVTLADKIAALKADNSMPWDDAHPDLQQQYATALMNGVSPTAARQQVDRASMDPMTRLINDLVNTTPVLSSALTGGVSVTAGAAAGAAGVTAGLGGMPATPPPDPDGLLPDSHGTLREGVDQIANDSKYPPALEMPANNTDPFPGVNVPTPGALANMPNSNSIGMTTIDPTGTTVPQESLGTTPVMDNPTSSLPTTTTQGLIGGAVAAGAAGTSSSSPLLTGTTSSANPGGIPVTGSTTPTAPPTTPTAPPTTTPTAPPTTTPTAPAAGGWSTEQLAMLSALGVVVGAGGQLVAGYTMANATKEAAGLQATAAENARLLQEKQFDALRADQKPWMDAGTEALGYERDAAGNLIASKSGGLRTFNADNPDFSFNTDPSKGVVDPSYAWRLGEGMKALENSAASRGMLQSGNTMKGITEYGQGAASQEYSNAFNRYQTTRGGKLNQLQSLAGVGQTATQQVGQAGQNYANQAGNAMMTGANATAGGITGSADATASGLLGAANTTMTGINSGIIANQRQQLYNRFTR